MGVRGAVCSKRVRKAWTVARHQGRQEETMLCASGFPIEAKPARYSWCGLQPRQSLFRLVQGHLENVARAPGAAALAVTPGQGDEASLRQSKRPQMVPAGEAALAAMQQENGRFWGGRSRQIDGRSTQAGTVFDVVTHGLLPIGRDGDMHQSITAAPPCRGKKRSDASRAGAA